MAATMGPLVLPRTPYAVSSARNNFKIDRYLNFSTSQVSDRYSGVVGTRTITVKYGTSSARLELKYRARAVQPGESPEPMLVGARTIPPEHQVSFLHGDLPHAYAVIRGLRR